MHADRPPPSRSEALLGALVLGLGGLAASTFLASAAERLLYPFEIEWLESGTLHQVARVLAGEGLYTEPAAEFSATIHPPLYAWCSAIVARLVGLGLLAPRLVSALSTLGIALLAGLAARRLSGFGPSGLFAACLVLACYVPCGTYLDLARLDSLWVLLLMASTLAAERAAERGGRVRALVAALLLALACATKQPAALFGLVLATAVLLRRRREGCWLLAGFGALTLGIYAALHAVSGGWSTTYLVTMPLSVPHRPRAFLHLLRDDVLGSFAPSLAILLLWGAARRSDRGGLGRGALVWGAGLGAALASTLAMRTIQGGSPNALLPLVAFGSVLVASLAGQMFRGSVPHAARKAVLVALGLQFLRLLYLPASLVPSAAERLRAEALVERIRGFEGDVWIPSHTSYAWHAGKPFYVHRDPLLDLLYTGSTAFPTDLLERLRGARFSAVIVDAPFAEPAITEALEAGYEQSGRIDDPPTPLVGYATRPLFVYTPRQR